MKWSNYGLYEIIFSLLMKYLIRLLHCPMSELFRQMHVSVSQDELRIQDWNAGLSKKKKIKTQTTDDDAAVIYWRRDKCNFLDITFAWTAPAQAARWQREMIITRITIRDTVSEMTDVM